MLQQKLTELEKKVENLQIKENSTKSGPTGRISQGRFPGRGRSICCWYPPCGKQHPGGWKECRLRKRNEPDWQPSLASNKRSHPASRAVHSRDVEDDSDYLS